MFAALLCALSAAVEVERVLALVNGVPVLGSDVELATAARVVPREAGESDEAYRKAVAEALVQLELRWQDLESAGVTSQLHPDTDAAWEKVKREVGGEAEIEGRLAALGLPKELLKELISRAALVEAYVARRFGPFARASDDEVLRTWEEELVPQLEARGEPVPELKAVRESVEAIIRERKLTAEVSRWAAELEARGEVVRYF